MAGPGPVGSRAQTTPDIETPTPLSITGRPEPGTAAPQPPAGDRVEPFPAPEMDPAGVARIRQELEASSDASLDELLAQDAARMKEIEDEYRNGVPRTAPTRATPLERDYRATTERLQHALESDPRDLAGAREAFDDAMRLLDSARARGSIDEQSYYFKVEFLATTVNRAIDVAMNEGARAAIRSGRPPNEITSLLSEDTRAGLGALAQQALDALDRHPPSWPNVMPDTRQGRTSIMRELREHVQTLEG